MIYSAPIMTKEQEDTKIARTVREHSDLRKQIVLLEDELRRASRTMESLVYPLRRGDTPEIIAKLQELPDKAEIINLAETLERGRQRRGELADMLREWGIGA